MSWKLPSTRRRRALRDAGPHGAAVCAPVSVGGWIRQLRITGRRQRRRNAVHGGRLARIADEMLAEIEQTTVAFKPNYDGTKTEPVVLPARIPNLLINGTTGIAVGMATNIPPHNLGEVSTALLKLLDNPDLSSAQLCRYIKGPDFPTGGQILNSAEELRNIYKTGAGTVRLRATWEEGSPSRGGQKVLITSNPVRHEQGGAC